MRAICLWDGSDHAMAALRQVVPLFRAQAFSHIEIMMLVWPQRDTPMWRVILEQRAVWSDLHQAAAEVSTAYGERLRAAILSAAEDVHVSIVDEDTVPAVRNAIAHFRADLVFCLIGPFEPDSQIAEKMRAIVRESTVPLWVLHANS
jgi:hypothetical protein